MPEISREAIPDHPSYPLRKPVPTRLPISPQKRNIRPLRGDPPEAGGPTTKMGRGLTPTIADGNDISPNTPILQKIPPSPLRKESQVNLTGIPHPQASLTLRLTDNGPRHLGDTSTPLNPSPKKLPLNADNLLPDQNWHLHDRHKEDRKRTKNIVIDLLYSLFNKEKVLLC
jgi:hypothetical protein